MKKILLAASALALAVTWAQAGLVYSDDFSATSLDPTVWNTGNGFGLNTNAQNVILSTFGSGWGSKGDGTGAAGLDSTVGYATFTVTDNGVDPIGGNFMVTRDVVFNVADALLRVPLDVGGTGTYQVVWNNSGVTTNFSVPGWSGTIAADATAWIVDGDTGGATWGTATAAANVDPLEAANRFGFWISRSSENAVIDDFEIYDNLDVVPPPPGCGAYLVCDDFDYSLPWPAWWNLGNGFFLSTQTQTALLSTFGTAWGSKGDGTGAAGLNSTVGYASFTVTDNGADPIGGNFIVTHNVNFNIADALVNVPLAVGGAGTYEVLWNNSGVIESFTMPLSGWSGTIAGDSTVWIVNGVTANAHWSPATSAPNVDPLEAANRFGFWVNVAGEVAIIDDVRIADTLTPGQVVEPTLTLSQSGSNLVVDWAESGFRLQNLTDELSTTNWVDYPLPGGTNPPVTVSVPVDIEFFRLIEQ